MRNRKRMGIVGGNRSMFRVWMDMLVSLGGSFTPFVPEPEKSKEHELGWRASVRFRVLNMNHYTRDVRGIVTRNIPKRDKSISARQWKKRVKAQHRIERVSREFAEAAR